MNSTSFMLNKKNSKESNKPQKLQVCFIYILVFYFIVNKFTITRLKMNLLFFKVYIALFQSSFW